MDASRVIITSDAPCKANVNFGQDACSESAFKEFLATTDSSASESAIPPLLAALNKPAIPADLYQSMVAACAAPCPLPEAVGYPGRAADLDALPGFRQPPPGYGEVPFWWWTGDALDADRMIAQVHELHKKGGSGVQVNYSHFDTPGWMSDQDSPEIFTEAWWAVYSRIADACASLNMGIGMSTYTIDWPRGARTLFNNLFYHKPEWNALQLEVGQKVQLSCGRRLSFLKPYPLRSFRPAPDRPASNGEPGTAGHALASGSGRDPI